MPPRRRGKATYFPAEKAHTQPLVNPIPEIGAPRTRATGEVGRDLTPVSDRNTPGARVFSDTPFL
jgi:hypothetical protein